MTTLSHNPMEATKWISVDDRMPDGVRTVFVVFETGGWTREDGQIYRHRTMAEYYPPMTCRAEDYWPDCEASELMEKDESGVEYIKGGFYETMYHSEECFWIGERVTHWMPFPRLPDFSEITDTDEDGK